MQELTLQKPKEKVKLEFVFCHRKPERSFFYKGRQFPVCARCTGFYAGYIALPIFTFSWWEPSFLWIGLMMVPAIADGTIQAYFKYESTNWMRFVTGLISGAGAMALAAIAGKGIGDLILLIFK